MQKKWLLLLVLYLASGSVAAQDWNTSITGEVTFAARQNAGRVTPLVAMPDRLEIEKRYLSITPVINFETSSDSLIIAGQARSEIQCCGEFNDERGTIDELYGEYAVTTDIFVFAGRRNIAFGQAESTYALDVFVDPLKIGRAKNLDRRRREVMGEDMAGFEALLTPEITFAGYFLPSQDKDDTGEHPSRSLATLSLLLPWQADVELLVLDDERDGIGLAYSQTVGDALLLYAEGMMRDGRDRERIDAINAQSGTAKPESDDFGQLTLGGNYIFANSLALTAEYYHDENGYSDGEWEEIAGIISGGDANRLLGLNRDLRHYTLRQNYGFLRLSHPEFFGLDITPELSTFHNLDDDSGTLSARFESELGNGIVGLYATSAYGDDEGEFKLRSPNQSAMIYWTLKF